MLSSQKVAQGVEDLAWRQWAAIGGDGSGAPWPADVVIDPEALICMTAWSTNRESRVRAVAIDWIRSNRRYLSASRFKGFARLLDQADRAGMDEMWVDTGRGDGHGRRIARRTVELPPLHARADLLVFRLRAIFGVGSRAEILRCMVLSPHRAWSVSQMATRAGYAKRSVAEALAMLDQAGVVVSTEEGNALRYRLGATTELEALAAPLPARAGRGPDWTALVKIQIGLRDIARCFEQYEPNVADVEAQVVRGRIHAELVGEGFMGNELVKVDPGRDLAAWMTTWFDKVTNDKVIARSVRELE